MKKVPIIKPATAAENTETINKANEPKNLFLNNRLYPMKDARTSNTTDAEVKPKKWRAVGLNIKLIIVAMEPTNVAVPIFLTNHTASIIVAKPTRSQKIGK